MELSIKQQVGNIIKKFGTKDPYEICRRMNIIITSAPLPQVTRGFCLTLKGGRAIVVNDNLNRKEATACIAHELGHIVLHEGLNYIFMSQNTCMVTGKYEREANIFAALLLTDGFVVNDGVTIANIAAKFALPEDAVAQIIT